MTDFKDEKLLVIAPHSDDEVLGCGGLISKIKNDGGKVYVLIFNLGFEKNDTAESQEKRKNEVINAMGILNVDGYHIVHDKPDNNRDLDAKPLHSLIEIIESTSDVSLEKIEPTMVAIPTIFSHHQDHVHVHKACIAALRPISTPVSNVVLSYEAPEHSRWSASGVFEPNLFVEILRVKPNIEVKKLAKISVRLFLCTVSFYKLIFNIFSFKINENCRMGRSLH